MKAHHTRARRVTSLGLALLFAVTAAVTCVPVAAEAAEPHCAPVGPTGGDDRPVLDCCVTSRQDPASLPEHAPAAGPDVAKSAAGLDTACGAAVVQPRPVELRVSLAPTHGYQFADLLTLHSVFLI